MVSDILAGGRHEILHHSQHSPVTVQNGSHDVV